MLMTATLSDEQIDQVTSAVRQWCRLNHCTPDSHEGRRAITISVDLIQTKPHEPLLDQLVRALGPFQNSPETFGGNETISHSGTASSAAG